MNLNKIMHSKITCSNFFNTDLIKQHMFLAGFQNRYLPKDVEVHGEQEAERVRGDVRGRGEASPGG